MIKLLAIIATQHWPYNRVSDTIIQARLININGVVQGGCPLEKRSLLYMCMHVTSISQGLSVALTNMLGSCFSYSLQTTIHMLVQIHGQWHSPQAQLC